MQVAIDATVAEVTLNDNLSYGVQFFLQTSHRNGLQHPGVAAGPTLGQCRRACRRRTQSRVSRIQFFVGSELTPNMILDALHAVTDVRVLSNPSLVVLDNQVATLSVGNDVPISTGSANVLNSATSTSNTIVNTIDYRSTGIILRVLPRVNVNGNVRLDIEQEISQVL